MIKKIFNEIKTNILAMFVILIGGYLLSTRQFVVGAAIISVGVAMLDDN